MVNLVGSDLAETLSGTSDNDTLIGLGGDDVFLGFEGHDLLFGNQGQDILFGNQGNDVLHGGKDNDVIHAGKDDDFLFGNIGQDILFGNMGKDSLYGGKDNDVLYGGKDNDVLYGDIGDDFLSGDRDNDTLYGGPGIDTLTGGPESDTFVLQRGQGIDIITDFQAATDSMKLPDGLSFDDINLQAIGVNLESTLITIKSTGEQLALLNNVQAASITKADFGIDQAGNTLDNARQIGLGTTPITFNDAVGGNDPIDLYKLCGNSETNINVVLSGLSADVNIEIIKDFNNNGVVDAGEIIQTSANSGTTIESIIDQPKPPGCIYVRVYPAVPGADTRYNLTVFATPPDFAGNTLNTARNIVINSIPSIYSDFVGNVDTNDYYRFTLNASSDFNLLLNGLSADANVRLLNSSGVVIETSANSGTTAESISRLLNAGTYYVQVNPGTTNANTNYNLSLSATQSLSVNTSAWTRQLGTTSDERSESITTDNAGNVYVVGLTDGVLGQPNQGAFDTNAWVAKYDKNGNLQWTKQLLEYIAAFYDVTVDSSGNVYATGENTYEDAAGIHVVAILLKYDKDGQQLWAKAFQHSGKEIDASRRVVLDNLGNIYLTGWTGSFGGVRGETNPSNDAWVTKLDKNGNKLWTKDLATSSSDISRGVAVDKTGNVYVTGFTGGSLEGQHAGQGDAWVAKYNNNGNLLWIKQFGTSSYDASYNIAVDDSGNVYISGETGGNLAATNLGGRDAWVAKYDTNGNRLWIKQFGSAEEDVSLGLRLTSFDNVYITGTNGNNLSEEYIPEDSWVSNFDSSGNLKWKKQLGTAGGSISWNIAIDNTGNIYTTGDTTGALEGTNVGGTDAWAIKYQVDPNGDVFNSIYGYGLVNAAAAVARAIGQATFADVPNLGGNNWGKDLINAPEVWVRGYTGQGITVAVIDTGVDITHPDLSANIWRNSREVAGNGIDDDGNGYIDDITGWNFSGNNNNVMPGSSAVFANGHGTHVAGVIAGFNNDFGVTGVAYDAKIMPIKLGEIGSDQQTFSNPGDLAAAIRYAVDNGARVINLSVGWRSSPELQEALDYAATRNIITVSSSGNAGVPSPGVPAEYATQYGISVGAVDRTRTIANFSNGAGADLSLHYVVAPGVDIYSTLPNNTYASLSGTSMAAPHVSGLVALMLGANPNLTAGQVRDIWTDSSTALNFSNQTAIGNNIMLLPSL